MFSKGWAEKSMEIQGDRKAVSEVPSEVVRDGSGRKRIYRRRTQSEKDRWKSRMPWPDDYLGIHPQERRKA